MFYFTNDQIDEIEKRLAVRAKKDTDFDAVSEAQEGDLVAIIHNGRNMICRLDKLPGRLVAKRYDEIPAEITEENILETPTAFSISVLKTLLGIEEMPEFDDDTAYEKGSYVSYTDANGILRGYVFTVDKPAGYWDESKATEINYASLSENIKNILSEFKSGGRVYILESYFTNGKAKKAIADEDGKNIKQYYALKTDIPDVNREIAEAIAVKLDNTPKGSHEVPIYIAPDLQTGYGRSEVIDSLHLPGDIRSDLDIFAGRGVAAYGMADLALGGRGGSGTLTEIQIDGTTIPDINGVVNLPAYPSALSQFTSDTTHRLVTDSQISSWTNKYDLPTGGIPKTDLSNSVQNTLNTADSSAVTLGNLIAGLTSKGAHNLPIYFDSNTDVQEIDSLSVPGNIQSTNGGVSAHGIATLVMGGAGGGGTVTGIKFEGSPSQIYTPSEGLITLPDYPSLAGYATQGWVTTNFADKTYESRVIAIESKIPAQASSSNQLADKYFVNSSVATATAEYQGNYNSVSDLSLSTSASRSDIATALGTAISGADNNDYCFVEIPTSDSTPTQIARIERYKFNGTSWGYEYTLNNSGFTAEQWAAINSGLTSTGATTITTLGTISIGEWQGTAISDLYIASAGTWNNAVTTLINLKTGLTSKGAHDLPVYLNSSAQAVTIDALSVPGNIQSTAGGVSAKGIADLSVSGGSAGTLTLIYVGDTPYPDVNGVVTLPAYPSTLDDISDGSSRKLSDYTKTTAFQTLVINGGMTSVGSYSPISGLELSILAGSNITVTPDATNHTITIANSYSYSLPTASSSTKGGVKVGNTLDISNEVLDQKAGIVTTGTYKSVTVDTYGRVTAGSNPTTLSGFGITDGVNGLQKSGSGYLSDVDFVEGNDHSLLFTFTSFAKAQIGHTGGSGTTTYKMRVKADGAWSDYFALQQAGISAWGIVTDQSQTFGGDKTFNGNIHGMQGVSAKGIATLELGSGGGSGTVTSIKFGSASVIVADNGLLSVPVGQGTSNGQIKIGGQDISVKGLAALAYLPSLSFSEITGTASDSQIPTLAISKISGLQTALDGKLATSLKGAANGLAELDANGLVPSSQLPSYVDDVLEYSSKSAFPSTGTSGKIYVALDTNLTYRWSGTAYVEISPSLALGETSSTAYRGDRGKTAYDHATETKSGAQNSGFYKFSVTAQGHISGVTAVTASDLTSLIGSTTYAPYNADGYLPLSGGTMTGDITIGKNSIKFNDTTDTNWNIGVSISESHLRILNTVGQSATGAPHDYSVGLSVKGYYGFQLACCDASNFFKIRSLGSGDSTPKDWVTLWHTGNSNLSTVDWATKKLTASDQIVSNVATGTAPLSIASTTLVSNLNADLLDGKHSSDFVSVLGTSGDYLTWTKTGGSANNIIVPYASLATDTRVENLTNQSITYRQTAGGGLTYKPSSAVVKRILGNSVAWNQLVNPANNRSDTIDHTFKGITATYNSTTKKYHLQGTADGDYDRGFNVIELAKCITGHKYFIYSNDFPFGVDINKRLYGYVTGFTCYNGEIVQYNANAGITLFAYIKSGQAVNFDFSVVVIDLTQFFNGNIPEGLTAETFERDYGYLLANSQYNEGQLINNSAKGLETGGFNLWDEETALGYWNGVAGDTITFVSGSMISSKNPIAVLPNTAYRFTSPSMGQSAGTAGYVNARFTDADGVILLQKSNCLNNVITSPAGAVYLYWNISNIYGTTYNHDICINLSDPAKNGQYEPYKRSVLNLHLEEFKVKDSQGNIITITGGLKQAGSVRDEIVGKKLVKRVGDVDLGDLSWTYYTKGIYNRLQTSIAGLKPSGGANTKSNIIASVYENATPNIAYAGYTNKVISGDDYNSSIYLVDSSISSSDVVSGKVAKLNGAYLNYELATPIEYEIIDEVPYEYPIDVLGTERIVSDELVAPFVADIQYGAEQRDIAVDINNLHISAGLLSNRASVLESYFTNGIANSAAKLTTVSKTAWGRTYWTSGGVPDNISGDMTGVGDITFQASGKSIGGLLYFDTTNGRLGVDVPDPSEKLHVAGNIIANGGVAARGMATLQGGAGTGNPITQINVGSTAYTPSSGVVSLPAYPTWSTLSGKPTNVSAFTNDSGYIDSSALAVTFTTTTLTSSSTSVYLNNTVQRDTLQKVTISSASSGQTFTINLKGSGTYYGYHRQVLVINNSGQSISLQLGGASYIFIGTYEKLTNGGWQFTSNNPIAMDDTNNYMYLLDVIEASSSEYPIVKVTRMGTWAN